MLSSEEITDLQFAIDDSDLEVVARLLKSLNKTELSELQFYSNSTAFMYALERSTPQAVTLFLQAGVDSYELPWSDNNELKSALRNKAHAPAMVELVLGMLEPELAKEMITSDWDPDDSAEGQAKSPMEMADKLPDSICRDLLRNALK